ncbi:hypothetical protein ES703_120732 [subsurface metagenome]
MCVINPVIQIHHRIALFRSQGLSKCIRCLAPLDDVPYLVSHNLEPILYQTGKGAGPSSLSIYLI